MADLIRPMLAKDSGEKPPVVRAKAETHVMEPKFDGVRMIWEHRPNGVVAYSGRNGRLVSGEVPEIEAVIARLPVGTIIDSELVVEGEVAAAVASARSKTATGKVRRKKLRAFAFDVLSAGDENVERLVWTERREILEEAANKFDTENVALTPVYQPNQELFEKWVENGFEGAIVKRKRSTYRQHSRTWDWVKLKPQTTTEAVVIGVVMGKGESNADEIGSLEIRLLETGGETSLGYGCSVEKGKTLIGKTIELRHHGWTVHGLVRHPIFQRWRPDRDPVG